MYLMGRPANLLSFVDECIERYCTTRLSPALLHHGLPSHSPNRPHELELLERRHNCLGCRRSTLWVLAGNETAIDNMVVIPHASPSLVCTTTK